MTRKINSKEYDNWSKEELIKEIFKIKSTTYGLVWHRDLPEEKIDILVNPDARTPNEIFPNEMAGKPFPVLKEIKSKAIKSDRSKLVNLLIEGNNYHSLAVLNFTHREALDLIYIDPPYNTGNSDFIYNDKFVDKEDSFRHSKWLSFMEKRLKLAKNLLKDSGTIFISIDDNELAPLRMLCDEIFGEQNFYGLLTWIKKTKPTNMGEARFNIQQNTEYVLAYGKVPAAVHPRFKLFTADERKYPEKDRRGNYRLEEIVQRRNIGTLRRDTMVYSVLGIMPKDGYRWQLSQQKYSELQNDKRLRLINKKPYQLIYSTEEDNYASDPFWSHIQNTGTAESGKSELNEILGIGHNFETVKPVDLIQRLVFHSTGKSSVVLDFFAGSGTTGQAVLQQNKEDGGARVFILCTDNRDEKSDHKIASDVCYPRIRKVIDGYKNQKGSKIDGLGGNLKYFTTDFVEAEPTDKNKRKLVKESTDMLCILENAFELVQETDEFKIFKNTDKYLGVIFYEEAIEDYKKIIKKIDGHFSTYVFSMSDDPHTKKFADVRGRVTLCAIPEVILKVYREIFK